MIYFFTGDNQFAIKQRLSQITKDFIADHGDLAVERIDAEETAIDLIIDATQSLPFLSSAKLVVIQNVTSKDLLDRLVVIDNMEQIIVVVLVPKVDKRANYYKKIREHPNFNVFDKTNARELPRWVSEYAKSQKGDISLSDARYLVERVGENQVLLGNEIDKLITYNPHITRNSIDDLTVPLPQSTVFELLDASFAGRAKEADRLYNEQRAQKVEPQAILGMIAWQLHVLAIVKLAGDKSTDLIAKEAKINPFVVRKTQNLARKLTLNDIKKLVKDALELDVSIKTKNIDVDNALLLYLAGFNSENQF